MNISHHPHCYDHIGTSCRSPGHGNMLSNTVSCRVSLPKFPSESPQQRLRSQHMLLLLLRTPGRRSWENTEPGPGSLQPDPSLWTPQGPQGPSGFRRMIHGQQSEVDAVPPSQLELQGGAASHLVSANHSIPQCRFILITHQTSPFWWAT